MKKPELFHKTVGILVNAYLNDSLEHSDCQACAVGNIISANMGYEDYFDFQWNKVFVTIRGEKQFIHPENYKGLAKEQIDSTGYTYRQLAKIEKAFELAEGKSKNRKDETWMFNGLMAVVDVLCEIHQMDEVAKSEAKALFVKPALSHV